MITNMVAEKDGYWIRLAKAEDVTNEELKLHRLALDVYSFNPSAEKVYLKAGFKREGVLRDAIMNGDKYADDILMSILEDEWRALKTDRNTEGDLQ